MAENPLLPNADLRALLDLTRRCANLDAIANRKRAKLPARRGSGSVPGPGSREALLAGTALQLKPGDLLAGEPGDATALALAPTPEGAEAIPLLPGAGLAASRLLLSVAMAAALRTTGSDRLVLHYLRADTYQPGWAEALAWAQGRLLPLILVCADPRGSEAFRAGVQAKGESFAWDAVRRTATKLQLPVLTVDGEDAVAVYRVMQESVLRVRSGAGPTILWAMLPSAKNLRALRPRAMKPIGRLERYLKARKLL